MQNKRGQVYIISAIIIILILIGLAGVTNRASYRQEPTKFYELGDELSGESFVLSAYGEYNNKSAQEIINNFTQGVFSNYVEPTGAEFIVIYGNKDSVTYTKYISPSRLTTSGGGLSEQVNVAEGSLKINETKTYTSPGTNIILTFQNQNYTINLGQNQEYYYIFTKSEGSDTFTYQG